MGVVANAILERPRHNTPAASFIVVGFDGCLCVLLLFRKFRLASAAEPRIRRILALGLSDT